MKIKTYHSLYGYIFLFAISITSIGFVKNKTKFKKNTHQNEVINVKTFGAKGDGKTDDYGALLAVSRFVNKKGSGSVYFPPGTYYIAEHHTFHDTLSNISFKNCDGLKITGNKAVISVNGNFKRTLDRKSKKHLFSYIHEITPLAFSSCKNVQIDGIEINGNVDKMTRDSNVVEGAGDLISIVECENVTITNVYVHHAQTDGIYIGGKEPSINVKVINCLSSNNARQGMSICNLYKGEITNCKFINTGITGGKYGNHSPSAGVDVEAEKQVSTFEMGQIFFKNCSFINNQGSQFVCTKPKLTGYINLTNCILTAGQSTFPYTVILTADSVVLDNCTIDCGSSGSVYAYFHKYNGSNVEIKNSIIKSMKSGIVALSDTIINNANIHNNEIICTAQGALSSFFPNLTMKNLRFTDNKIFIPSSLLKTMDIDSKVENAASSTGNKFYTELSNLKPKVSYKGTVKVKDQ